MEVVGAGQFENLGIARGEYESANLGYTCCSLMEEPEHSRNCILIALKALYMLSL